MPNIIGIINKIEPSLIIWNIANFSSLLYEDDYPMYSSPSFSFADEQLHFNIYPNGNERKQAQGYISLCFWRETKCEMDFHISFGFKTLDGENYAEHCFKFSFSKTVFTYYVDKCLKRSELFERESQLLPNDILTVFCNLKSLDSSNTPSEVTIPKPLKILQDFEQLFLKQKNTDVVFIVKGVEIPAHRAVLEARSSVFESTFRNDMTEKLTGIVNVEDFDSSIYSNFLHFLYSGDVSIISPQNATGLFTASDKYDVVDLKTACITFMKENITVEIFCEIMTLALQHSETDLVNVCSSFFIKNADKITKTVKWQLFVKQNPTESNELFIKFIEAVQKYKK